MKASAEKFVCILHEDHLRQGAWVAFLTWRLGHRGAYVVRARSESELREKLARLDPTIRFHGRNKKKQEPEESQPHRFTLADVVRQHLGGRKENEDAQKH